MVSKYTQLKNNFDLRIFFIFKLVKKKKKCYLIVSKVHNYMATLMSGNEATHAGL